MAVAQFVPDCAICLSMFGFGATWPALAASVTVRASGLSWSIRGPVGLQSGAPGAVQRGSATPASETALLALSFARIGPESLKLFW